jgi:uncharacterized SAM-binding protein YcdF (DUF218 family)
MSYQVGYLEVLKAYFMPWDLMFILLFTGIPIFSVLVIAYKLKNSTSNRYCLFKVLVPVIVLSIVGMFVGGYLNAGTGWRLR